MDDRSVNEKEKDQTDVSIQGTDESVKTETYAPVQDVLLGPNRAEVERKLVRKLDVWLLPTVVVIFILNYIDVSFPTCLGPLRHIVTI